MTEREDTLAFIRRVQDRPIKQQMIEFWHRAENDLLQLDPTGTKYGDNIVVQKAWEAALLDCRSKLDDLGQ